MKTSLVLLTTFSIAIASAQQVEVTNSDRYFELSTFTLNEPCLIYNDVSYKAQFVLDDRAEDGLYWSVIRGEEIAEIPDDCELVLPSVLTTDPTIPFISYNIENVIIADGNVDTGLRYSIASRADANHLELGFSFDWMRELREAESISLNGAGIHSFSGPSSFPFESERVAIFSFLTSHSFSGSFSYDIDANIFTVELDSTNESGSYELTVVFGDISRGLSGLQVVYPIEFTLAQ